MNGRLLSIPERIFVEEARANTRDKVAYMKLSVLVLLDEGLTQERTATLLGIGLGTVNKCKQKYEDDGLDKYLDKHYVPYSGKLTDEQLAMLDDQVSEGIYSTCSQINDWIENNFGFRYSESALRSILHKLDFSYKKTTNVPGGLNPVEQAAFLDQLEPFLAETDPETEVVCFMDAVHPQHNTRSDYVWTKRGQNKEVSSNTGRNRLNINGAMNAHAPEEVTVVESECINAQSTQKLLEKLLDRYEDKETIWVIADNARYYDNTTLRDWLSKNPKIQIIHLPPYSPNLNLIERLWKFMRKKVINLHYYPKFDDFRRAVLDFFQNIGNYKWDLETLITPNFQRFSASPGIR